MLHVTNARSAAESERHGITLVASGFTFEDLVQFRSAGDRDLVVDRARLARAHAELDAVDGFAGEAPEALLLHYLRAKRGLRPLRWLVNVVQVHRRVDALVHFVRRHYGDDPWELAASAPGFHWCYTSHAHGEVLRARGLPADRTHFFPSTSSFQEWVDPETTRAYAQGARGDLPADLSQVRGQVLMGGNNDRDLATLARAADLLQTPIHVITDRARGASVYSRWLVHHDVVPTPVFVTAVASASALVVPLVPGSDSCGQQSISIAQRVGTPVVVSDVPAAAHYVRHASSGFVVPPGDAEALARAIREATHGEHTRLIATARERDARDGDLVGAVFRRAYFDGVFSTR